MFHNRTRTFTRAVIAAGLIGFTAAGVEAQAAQGVATPPAQAQQAEPANPDAVLAAKIRKAITDDKAIAAYGPTLKIIVSSGTVSLKGKVKTEAEKKAIGEKADQIAGAANVMNNLIVAPNATNSQTH
jgi:osmotically-inducible protein OsmY